ncbi:MAG: histidinol-phosphate transaminase [Actinomycetota bacterium]|nr:histidinol-phosphate transaminase [Actinomycetota bacterium]
MTAPRYRWQPTTAEIAERYGLDESDVIRFDHNTSPFSTDWAPALIAPMARRLNEYPGALYSEIREAAAGYLGVDSEMVVPGAGIDEIIGLVANAFLGRGQRATAVTPTYPMYQIASLQRQAEFVSVSYEPDFVFPAGAFGEAAQTSDVTWLCVPNNPTGDRVPDDIVASIIEQARGIVVIDAAYAEFAGDVWARWVERYDNLIVAHTMSKAFGLAGIRVGYSISAPKIADRLDSVRPPGSISSISAELASVALGEPQRMQRRIMRLAKEKSRMSAALTQLGIQPRPSETNFLLCDVGPQSGDIAGQLLTKGLVVRHFPDDHPLVNFLRFTVRAPHENDRLIDALWRQLS